MDDMFCLPMEPASRAPDGLLFVALTVHQYDGCIVSTFDDYGAEASRRLCLRNKAFADVKKTRPELANEVQENAD